MARIAVVGSGALGLFYGTQMVLAGHDVRFLLRRDYELIRSRGIRLTQSSTPEVASTQTQPEVALGPDRFRSCRTPEECVADGPVDWVLLGLKTTALDAGIEQLRPILASGTPGLVAMCNGLGVEDRLAQVFEPSRIYGGLCSVCVQRRDDGSVYHQAYGKVTIGHMLDHLAELAPLQQLLDSAGIQWAAPACLLEARWRKQAWNIPFNGLGVAVGEGGVDTEHLLSDPRLRALVEALIREVADVANADLQSGGKSPRIDPDKLVQVNMVRTEQMGAYLTSTTIDYQQGRPLEVEHLFAEPVRRADRLSVAAPRMAMLLALVADRNRRVQQLGDG